MPKKLSLMDRYHRSCQRVRRQAIAVEIQQAKVSNLQDALFTQQERLRVVEKQQRKLETLKDEAYSNFKILG